MQAHSADFSPVSDDKMDTVFYFNRAKVSKIFIPNKLFEHFFIFFLP